VKAYTSTIKPYSFRHISEIILEREYILNLSRFHEKRSMNISRLSLINWENSKNDEKMPSLISNRCDPSSKTMEESLEESIGQQQYYSVTLGVGPLWWS
jgi:hypothetical protein